LKLYFARHGESEANVQRIFWDKPHGYGLTDKGREQARALADSLAAAGWVALYCSPILRAVQTAHIVGRRLNLKPQIEDALRERVIGILEGQEISPENRSLCWQVTQQWMQGNHDARIEMDERRTHGPAKTVGQHTTRSRSRKRSTSRPRRKRRQRLPSEPLSIQAVLVQIEREVSADD
jgi:broad specificity phosphatase PhoE